MSDIEGNTGSNRELNQGTVSVKTVESQGQKGYSKADLSKDKPQKY